MTGKYINFLAVFMMNLSFDKWRPFLKCKLFYATHFIFYLISIKYQHLCKYWKHLCYITWFYCCSASHEIYIYLYFLVTASLKTSQLVMLHMKLCYQHLQYFFLFMFMITYDFAVHFSEFIFVVACLIQQPEQ